MHELVELVHHGLQEGPVIDEEVRELTHHVHDIARNERLRVLRVALLTKVEQLLDHGAQKLVFALDTHAAGNGSESPA